MNILSLHSAPPGVVGEERGWRSSYMLIGCFVIVLCFYFHPFGASLAIIKKFILDFFLNNVFAFYFDS